jgi:hypothetical protein
MAVIVLAHEGRMDMLKAIFGANETEPPPPPPPKPQISDESIKMIFRHLAGPAPT